MTKTIILMLILCLSGCAAQPQRIAQPEVMSAEGAEVRQRLLVQYQEWQGVPYRLGGTDKRGVDCSAFTQLTFREQLGVELPRTTVDQVKQGKQVSLALIKPGDLLFYRSSIKVRHVGIYLGEGQFLHASTSRGVMISELDNPYWVEHFWQARRPDL
ncbi:NlpC/P60 family protein [Amphritea japonica]|uniref:Lipoprotein NlpC n=1 Tax=Amphritea japonica ATCC BAA-1530 TaxID=1278309 RepID=A0A7R6SS25_9GAMM|nr:NlpC/P60 family protein [Amphritea japonica]BBB25874.1 lipoprotein NlpC [Amphritea japonica ATCC BAA-1530]